MDKFKKEIDGFINTKINEEAISIERVHFYKTDRRVNPKQESPFRLFVGNIPILVCAPHSVRYIRQKKIKKSDEYTGAISYLLNRLTGCHSLVVTKLYGGDPSFDNPCIYKKYLTEICYQHNIKLILDLHGAARKYSFDVNVTCNEKTLLANSNFLPEMINIFTKAGLLNVSQDFFQNTEIQSINNFASQNLKTSAVQLEFNRKFRVPSQNPKGFCRLMAALTTIINEINLNTRKTKKHHS